MIYSLGLLLFVAHAFAYDCEDGGECDQTAQFSYVTCGSVVKLKHIPTNYRLHSHEVSYGNSGSGQQSVTSVKATDDTNSLWTVLGSDRDPCSSGDIVKSGQKIRLRHVNTHKNLHSHLHRSPLSGNQEVSAFDGNDGAGDSGDDWALQVVNGKEWVRGEKVRLQHVDTKTYLETSARHRFGNPIPGQLEVYSVKQKTSNGLWQTEEGIYFATRS